MYKHHSAKSTKKQQEPSFAWERLQFLRLLWALALFLTVFLGKQIYPDTVISIGQNVIDVLGRTTDFETVFAQLGDSLVQSGGTLKGIGDFCVEVFGIQEQDIQMDQSELPLPEIPSGTGLLNNEIQRTALFSGLLRENAPEEVPTAEETVIPEAVVPAVGTVLIEGTEPEQALPAGYTVDKLSFGSLETVAPVLGYLNSGFGYRDHPVNGKYLFHGGVDISANAGDPIAAFAAGTVEYIGEDDSYGLYFQLDHGDGIKSFYAHCQSVCVQKGQSVAAGENVAYVGSTGTATGPHLHLELKCGDQRVDPAYYVTFLTIS